MCTVSHSLIHALRSDNVFRCRISYAHYINKYTFKCLLHVCPWLSCQICLVAWLPFNLDRFLQFKCNTNFFFQSHFCIQIHSNECYKILTVDRLTFGMCPSNKIFVLPLWRLIYDYEHRRKKLKQNADLGR